MTIRLIIIDDHELVRDALALYLNVQPGIEVVAEAANAEELLQKLRTISADLLLLDLAMPGLSGLDVIPVIKSLYPDLPILMLSAQSNLQMVRSAMQAGASGFICKTSSPATLLEAIKEVMVMGKYLPRDMAEKLLLAPASRPYINEINDCCGVTLLNGDGDLTENTSTRQSHHYRGGDYQNCRTREIGSSGLVECQLKMISCKYALLYAKVYFCRHPSGLQFISN